MTKENYENNQMNIAGEIISNFTFSHEVYGEKYYEVEIRAKRLSGVYDTIPLLVSENLIDVATDYKGCFVKVSGQFRSHNMNIDGIRRLKLFVFAKEIVLVVHDICSEENNEIYLNGHVCKQPSYRTTPLGREITDIMLAVNRPHGKTDYIPCICWGINARLTKDLSVGDECSFWGRVQSREYTKQIDEETAEQKIAYEASIKKISLNNNSEEEMIA